MSKYQKHVACSYGSKLVCVDDKFGKPLSHTWVKILLTNLLIVLLKKVNTVLILLKPILTKNL